MSRIALDTNILIYLHDINDSSQRKITAELIAGSSPVIFSQVVSEYLNVCNKRLKMSKEASLESLMGWLPFCELFSARLNIFGDALRLIKRYDFQMFDAVVVASALEADCAILYSEDMQHNLLVDKKLTIINPYS